MSKLGFHQEEFMKDLSKLLVFIHSCGYEVRGGELFRPAVTQKIYVSQGRSKAKVSNHQKKLAIDLHIFTTDGYWLKSIKELEPIGIFWESLHPLNRWGGHFKSFVDCPHFERNV